MATTYDKHTLRSNSRYWAWKSKNVPSAERLIDLDAGENGEGRVIASNNNDSTPGGVGINTDIGCLRDGMLIHLDGYYHPATKEDAGNYKYRACNPTVGKKYTTRKTNQEVLAADIYTFCHVGGKYAMINISGQAYHECLQSLEWFNKQTGWRLV